VGMTACSDEDMPGGNEGTPVSQSTVTVGNDPTAQADRITFYGPNAGTRAGDNGYPEFSAIDDEPQLNGKTIAKGTKSEIETQWQQDKESKLSKTEFEITTSWGQQLTVGKWNSTTNQMDPGVVYISGNVSDVTLIDGAGTVYIMSTGSLCPKQQLQIGSGVTVKAFGNVTLQEGADLLIQGKLLSKKNVTVSGKLTVEGNAELIAEKLEVSGHVQFNSQSKVKARCISFKYDDSADQDVNLTGACLAVQNYMYCESLYMDGTSRVFLWPNAMAVIVDRLSMAANGDGGIFYHTDANPPKTDNALVKTDEFLVNGDSDSPKTVENLFSGILKLAYNKILTQNDAAYNGDFIASAKDYYISPDHSNGNCNPGNGKKGSITFDPVAKVEAPTHDHTHLSATCVQTAEDGKRAYVSYHLNEGYKDNAQEYLPTSKHMGCVEYYTITTGENGGAAITSWLMNKDFDFNHLIVKNDKLYVVGDKENGANLGVVSLNGGAFTEGNTEAGGSAKPYMQTYKLYNDKNAGKGGSGNCILYDNNNNFLIASYNGFQMLDASTLAEKADAFLETSDGSAKHIAMNEKYIVTLNLNKKGKDVTESSATVNVYNVSGFSGFKGTHTSFQIPRIAPIDGKNVIAVRGEHVYVALGEAGVAKYNVNGTLEASYSWIDEKLEGNANYKGHPRANGLYVDAEYVYVANGEAGMIVLNSGNLKRVARYARHKANVPYSANYVQKVGDLIYIAYGRNGLEVVKMIVPSKDNTTNE